jgi:hypothetical protein
VQRVEWDLGPVWTVDKGFVEAKYIFVKYNLKLSLERAPA